MNIVLSECENKTFKANNIFIARDNYGGYSFLLPKSLFGETGWQNIPMLLILEDIAELINCKKELGPRLSLEEESIEYKLYPYIKALWSKYLLEMEYYN